MGYMNMEMFYRKRKWLRVMKNKKNHAEHPYHIVKPSVWPFFLSWSMFSTVYLFVKSFHGWYSVNNLSLTTLFALVCLIGWFKDITNEAAKEGRHTKVVQNGIQLGFFLFIVSEVMFFFSFFWAFFYSSNVTVVETGISWPPLGVVTMDPWGLPLVNTLILLSSGVSITWAHKKIVGLKRKSTREESFRKISYGIALTIFIGIVFSAIQLFEYCHALFTIEDGIYASVFFLLTGFHGFHVLIGTVFIIICLFRHWRRQYVKNHHLGFEAAIWYWHFVDVVWLFLYIFIYVWGV